MLLNLAEVGRIIVLDKFESDTKAIIKDTKGNFASGGNMTICDQADHYQKHLQSGIIKHTEKACPH